MITQFDDKRNITNTSYVGPPPPSPKPNNNKLSLTKPLSLLFVEDLRT